MDRSKMKPTDIRLESLAFYWNKDTAQLRGVSCHYYLLNSDGEIVGSETVGDYDPANTLLPVTAQQKGHIKSAVQAVVGFIKQREGLL